jgi:hypothetical protein
LNDNEIKNLDEYVFDDNILLALKNTNGILVMLI